MDALTQYYFQVEVRVNSTISISRRSFMTGECKIHICYVPSYLMISYTVPVRLTDANIGLLIIGILFLILSILVCMPLFQKCKLVTIYRVKFY